MLPLLALLFAVALGAGIGARDAQAARRSRVAVLDVEIAGDAPPDVRRSLDRSLEAGLTEAGWDVVGRDEVATRLRGAPELVGCVTSACLEQLRGRVGAGRFVRGRVQADGASYTVTLALFASDGSVLQSGERSCAPCTVSEAGDIVAALAARIDGSQVTAVAVSVVSDPPGAEVHIGGRRLGRAPLRVELAPGEHVVRATVAGAAVAEERVVVEPRVMGPLQEVRLRMVVRPAPRPAAPRPPVRSPQKGARRGRAGRALAAASPPRLSWSHLGGVVTLGAWS